MMKLEGGCLCKALRYRIDAEVLDACYCHCHQCQQSSGAPVLAWFTVPFTGFSYIDGEPGIFQSSEHYHREHCKSCGTQLLFRQTENPLTVDFTLCSLDDSSQLRPKYHIWLADKAEWLHIEDGLPRYDGAGPDE